MRAVQMVAPYVFEVVEAPKPTLQRGQALLRMRVNGLCGSDLHVIHRRVEQGVVPSPIGFSGHECIAMVEASDDPTLTPGQSVLYLPPTFDGLAEYLAVDPANCVPAPVDLAPRDAVMSQQLGTVVFAAKKLGNLLDKTVVVLGQGPAGLNFTALLRNLGARTIIVTDQLPRRLAVARQLGADVAIDVSSVDPVAAILDLTHGIGADVVVEAVGVEATVNQAYQVVRPFGVVLIFGVPKTETFPGFRLSDAFRKQATTHMSVGAQQEPGLASFRLAMQLLSQRRIDLAPTLTHCLPIDQVQAAYDLARTGDDGAVKILVEL